MFKQFHLFEVKKEMNVEEVNCWLKIINAEINDGVVLTPSFIKYQGLQTSSYLLSDCSSDAGKSEQNTSK